MKPISFFLLFSVALSSSVRAQSAADILEAYPLNTAFKIENVKGLSEPKNMALSEEHKKLLSLDQVKEVKDNLMLAKVYVAYRLQLKESFQTVVFRIWTNPKKPTSFLVNYSPDFKITGTHLTSYYHSEDDFKQTRIRSKELFSDTKVGNRTSHRRFLFTDTGKIVAQQGKSREQLRREGIYIHSRMVKARNGLIIRDKEGKRIGKFDFGAEVDILEYIGDSTSFFDEGRRVSGRKAKVILDYDAFQCHLQVPSYSYPSGYVFEGFLFVNIGQTEAYGEDCYDYTYNKPYQWESLYIGKNSAYKSNINLKEFLDIKRVKLSDYESKIQKRESFIEQHYQTNSEDGIKLNFDDGSSRVLKDTVYENREYSPTQHYQKFKSKNFEDAYLILNSFFEDHHFDLLDKKNGDTIFSFEEYPFLSPNRKMAISLKTPFTYDEGTSLIEFIPIKNNTFRVYAKVEFINWNLPNDKSVYWLSDNEFILKVKEVEDAFSNEENAQFYYLKIKFKNL
jgi:hypothetical protein